MRFADIKGNADVVKALSGMISSGKIPHAIMLHEDDGGGAILLAQAFLQMLFCRQREASDCCGECPCCNKISKLIHPDVRYIFPVSAGPKVSSSEKPTSLSYIKEWRELVAQNPYFTEMDLTDALGIEKKSAIINVLESRQVLDMLAMSSLEGGYRAIVVYLPEKMNTEAANRLLKAIEEPPEKTQFIMITHAPEKVLTTIASRCQRIRVVPDSGAGSVFSAASMPEESALFSELMESLLSKNLLESLEIGDRLADLSREKAKLFCSFASEQIRLIFLQQQGLDVLLPEGAAAELSDWHARCRKTFPRGAESAFSRARGLVDRNVNSKILFTDLIDRLSMII